MQKYVLDQLLLLRELRVGRLQLLVNELLLLVLVHELAELPLLLQVRL